MKKIISLMLVSIMLFAGVAAAIPASAVDWIEETDALYFDKKPYIDGYITEAEWGEPTTVIRQSDAVTVKDSDPGYNRFFYKLDTFDDTTLSLEYTLWLRWDENCFYVGVKAKDPDGHSLKNGRYNTWDGDAFRCRIDPEGSNAATFGATFTPDMTPDGKPWSSSGVCDLQFGYCEFAGGFTEAYDFINRKGMTALSNNPLGACEIGIAPAGYSYSTDTANGITTYEIAIPWAYIEFDLNRGHEFYKESYKVKTDAEGNIIQGPKGAIGREYGMSSVLYNADGASGAHHYNALLSWGSGVCTVQENPEYFKTCGGSNAVILSGTKVSEAGAVGDYATYTLGGFPSKKVEKEYDTKIDKSPKAEPKWEYKNLTYDYEDDMSVIGWAQYGERVQDETGNWVVQWDKDTGDTPESPTESGLSAINYIATEGESGEPNDFSYASLGCSYTMEFDVRVTGTEEFAPGNDSALYSWFGGSDGKSFACGYFFDDGKFMAVDTQNLKNPSASALASKAADFSLNEWHHWVFQYDNDTCVMRFYFDPAMKDGHVSRYAVPIFAFRYRYFDYGGAEECILALRRMNCQIQLDNIRMYNLVEWTNYEEDQPGKPVIIGLKPVYYCNEEPVFSWTETENTTHYNLWLNKFNDESLEWEEYECTYYAKNNTKRSLPEGYYSLTVQSINLEYIYADSLTWLHTDSDTVYFSVIDTDISSMNGLKPSASAVSGDTVYERYDYVTNWESAQKWCEAQGGYLATISNEEENSCISSITSGNYWIGAVSKEKNGSFEWVTDEPFTYTNWCEREPDASNNNEAYVYSDENGSWNSSYVNSYLVKGFILERPNAPQIIAESKSSVRGDSFTVSVNVKNNPGFTYLEVTPTYSSELTLVGVENGELISDFSKGNQYIWVADNDVTDDGILLTFTFTTADSIDPGKYEVRFTVRGCVNNNGQNVDISVINGEIEIVEFIQGDTNGDGVVTLKDVLISRKYVAGVSALTEEELSRGDLNGDGVVTLKDVLIMRKMVAGVL